MKNHNLKHLVALTFLLFSYSRFFSQCTLSSSPASGTINCGQSLQLNAFGVGGSNIFADNFNIGAAGSGWLSTTGAQYDNPCSPGPGGAYLWMGPGSAAPRVAQTIAFNIPCTGTLCFDLRLALQGTASPCEGPDATGEGVYVQYSTNGGTTWTTLNYFDPAPSSGTDPVLTSWHNYCYTIPAGAISANTIFRWAQTTITASGNDHWGIDNVSIVLNCGTPYYYSWLPATGLSASNIANPVASPSTSTTYTVYFTNGVHDTCSAVIPVTVISPTADAGTVQTICAGSSINLAATSSFNAAPQTLSFIHSATDSIKDLQTLSTTVNVTGFNQSTINSYTTISLCLNLTHTWDADLSISLVCPGGTVIDLSSNNGSSGDNYTNTCFSATAATAITAGSAPFTGTFTPEQAFSNLMGCLANGTWTLKVKDGSGGDVGLLNNWTLTLTDNTPYITSVNWAPNTNITGGTTLTPTVSPAATTTYTVTVTGSSGCSASDTVTVFVNPMPVANAGADASTCAGTPVNLLASGGTTYSWTPAATLSNTTIANPVASPVNTTDYIVTTTIGTCSDKDTVRITVKALPVIDAGNNAILCTGASVNIIASGGQNYTWAPATNLSATNIANPVATPTATITYTLTGTAANGCANTDSLTLTVNNAPSANAGPDTSFCVGSSLGLNATGGGTYSWSPAGGLSSSTIANPVANPAITTTYILTVTLPGGCTAKDTVVVAVNPLPLVDAGTNHIICPGSSATLSATGAASYTWLPAGTLNNPATAAPVATPTVTTTYIVTGTDANGCKKTDAVTVVIGPGLTVTASNDVTVCAGTSTGLNVTGTANTYSWSPATGLNANNTSGVTATPLVTTTYTATVTNTATGCTGKDSVTVTVNPVPTANAGIDTAACSGASVGLLASGGTSYSWLPVSDLSSATIANPVCTPVTTIQYTVTVTNVQGCSDKDTVVVTFKPFPTMNPVLNDTVCNNTTTLASNFIGTPAATTFTWTNSNTSLGLAGNGTGNVPAFLAHHSMPFDVNTVLVVTPVLNGCPGWPQVYTILVKASPVVNPVATINVCNNTLVPASAYTSTPAGATFTWTNSNTATGLASTTGAGNTPSFTATNTSPTGLTSTISVVPTANTCAGDTFKYNINVYPIPEAPSVSNVHYCKNAVASPLTASGTGSLNWYLSSTSTLAVAAPTPLTTTAGLTSYYVSQTINGCESSRLPLNVNIYALPVVTMSPQVAGCAPLCKSYGITSTFSLTSYSWNMGDGSIAIGNDTVYQYCYNTAGSYNLSVTVSDTNNCTSTTTFNNWVTVYQVPKAGFSYTPQPISILSPEVSFINETIGDNIISNQWWFGDPKHSISYLSDPSFVYADTGHYTVQLAIANANGCKDTITKTLLIENDFTFYIPNAFSPTNDGLNEGFIPLGIGISTANYEFTIYDRWGNKVFQTDDVNKPWDGKIAGTTSQEDVFVWTIACRTFKGERKKFKGQVSLIK